MNKIIFAGGWWAIFLLFIQGGLLSGQDAVTVGDPNKPADLPQAMYDAHKNGANDITIAPGTYDLPSMKTGDTIVLDKWIETTIHANGVTLIFEDLKHSAVVMWHCRQLTWDGGTLQYVQPCSTQGRVIAMDPDHSTLDWQIEAGYPINREPTKFTYNVVDASTRLLKVGTSDWGPSSVETLPTPGAFRFHYQWKPGCAVNDWLVTRANGGNETMHLGDCENCTLKNLTLLNGGFATFFETDGPGGNHYLNCKIQPGPRPPGATEDEIVSNGADGFHSGNMTVGPDIEDCTFTGVFLDDCIAIHGYYGRVIKAEGNTIIMKHHNGDPIVVGEPLRISDNHGFFAQAMVTAVQNTPNGDFQITLDQDYHIPIDHTQDKNENLGTKANNPNHCGRGFKILRCRLGDTRSRGILVKADDGVIDSCTIDGCLMSGVSIGPEFWEGEANYTWNVTVTHNLFHNCSKDNGEQATALVHAEGPIGNRNIIFQDNVFDTCYGRYLFRIEGTDGVQIIGNKISKSFTVKNNKPGNIVQVKSSKNVLFQGNQITDQGEFAGDLVYLDKDMNPTDVQNNDATGFVVTDAKP